MSDGRGLGRWVGEDDATVDVVDVDDLRAAVAADARTGLRQLERTLRQGRVPTEQVPDVLRLACTAALAAHGGHGGPLRALRLVERHAAEARDIHPAELLGVAAHEVAGHPGLPALRAALDASADTETSAAWSRLRRRLLTRLPPSPDELATLTARWESARRQHDLHRLATAHVRAGGAVAAATLLLREARQIRRADLRISVLQRAWALACPVDAAVALEAGRQVAVLAPSERALLQLARVPAADDDVLNTVLDELYGEPELAHLQALAELLVGLDEVVEARLLAAAADWSEAGHPAPPTLALLVALGCPLEQPDEGTACTWLARQGPADVGPLHFEGAAPSLTPLAVVQVLRRRRPSRRTDAPWYRDLVGQLLTRRCAAVRGNAVLHADFVDQSVAWADTVRLAEGDAAAVAALERLAAHAPRHRVLRRALSLAAVAAGLSPTAQ